MPTAQEVAYRLYGAWRLFRLDRGGMAFFDDRIETFWRSFFAAVLVAPGYAIIVLVALSGRDLQAGFLEITLIEIIGYCISWTAFPLVLVYLADALDRSRLYTTYITAFNWAKVIQMALYLPVSLMNAAGLLPEQMMVLLYVAVTLIILGYEWYVTKVALDVPGMTATGIVAFDLVLGITITYFSESMLY